MRYHVDLTSPEAVARQLNTVNPAGAVPAVITDKANAQYANFWAYVTECCQSASAFITAQTGRSFVPYRDSLTIVWDDVKFDIKRGRLPLNEDLLILSTLDFGALSITASDYRVSPSSALPTDALFLSRTSMTGAVYDFGAAYVIDGIWGYVTNLSQAWTRAQASLSIGSTTATAITVTVGTSVNYETLSYLKIDDEYLQVTDIDLATDVLTVVRGVNGTTAAIHNSAALYRFNPEPDVAKAATLLAAYFYQRRSDAAGSVQYSDGSINLDAYPINVRDVIRQYQRKKHASVTGPRSYGL